MRFRRSGLFQAKPYPHQPNGGLSPVFVVKAEGTSAKLTAGEVARVKRRCMLWSKTRSRPEYLEQGLGEQFGLYGGHMGIYS